MVRLTYSVELDYQVQPPGATFIFNIQAASTARQRVVTETLQILPSLPQTSQVDPVTHGRHLRLQAPAGPLALRYQATVDIDHHGADPATLREVPVADLPGSLLPYLYPSRYCESDRLQPLALQQFGALPPGHARVLAVRDWVRRQVRFRANSSDSRTGACDTLASGQGVCRDFAHLMIAMCRALNLPARFATGIDYGADPALGPTDFHAYVEVFLSNHWYLFDPSGTAIPMGFVRIGTGRDAADAAFATIFGAVHSAAPRVGIFAHLDGATRPLQLPVHTTTALSTAASEN